MAPADNFTMEEVTERLGITSRTMHYYEEIGLLPDVARTEGGHRLYGEAAVERIGHILRLKHALGASLQEIRGILQAEEELDRIRSSYRGESRMDERDRLLDEAIERLQSILVHIDEKMAKLLTLREGFGARLERARRLKKEQRDSKKE